MIDWMIDWLEATTTGWEREREEADPLVGWNGQIPWGGGSDSFFFGYLRLWLAEKEGRNLRLGWDGGHSHSQVVRSP